MKKVKILLFLFLSIFAFNINALAVSTTLSVSSNSVYVGDSFTVSVNMNSAAAWNIHVSASGPVSGCSINQADATADAMDTNKTFTATCTATEEGTIFLTLSGDVTSAIDGNAVNISGSKSVTVSKKVTPPSNNNNDNNSGGNTNTNNNNNNNNVSTKSKNNNIKELSIDGYELEKVDANNYTLSVNNDITSVNIKAIAEDPKANITGTGVHELNIGENEIEIIVTSESGLQNKINIKITRKDGYYMEDLESLLNNNKIKDINIIIASDSKISIQDLTKIKNSKKTVKFNYYDENKKLIYSWIIDGSKIKTINELSTAISYESKNKKEILKLSNYAEGLYITLNNTGNIPEGTKIKLYVGDKFDNNNMVNFYGYIKGNDKLNLIKNNIKVEDGYIELNIDKTNEYFITMSNILYPDETLSTKKSSSIILPVIISIIIILIIAIISIYFLKKKKSTKDDKNLLVNNNSSITNNSYDSLDSINTNNEYNNLSNNYSTNNNQGINNSNIDYSNYNNSSSQDNDNINPFY